ncbi:MAG: hypothetical protein GXO90_06125 [FCB group bacterium]|nr:hypothetical protein [FCB group bacterium]
MRYLNRYVFIGILLTGYAFSSPDSLFAVVPHAGSKALEFRIRGLFNIDSHLGNGITLKTFTGTNRAIRIGIYDNVVVNDESGERNREDYYQYQDTLKLSESSIRRLNNLSAVQINLQFIRYSAPYYRLSLSYGLGPVLGFSDRQTKNNTIGRHGDTSVKDNTRTTMIYTGLSTIVGVEWFFRKNISFHSEYHTSIKVGKSYNKASHFQLDGFGNWYRTTENRAGPYYQVTGNVWFGTSFYFK